MHLRRIIERRGITLTIPPIEFSTTILKTSDLSTCNGNAFSVSTSCGSAYSTNRSQPSSSQRKYAMLRFPSPVSAA
jgi:hypothetical protein